MKSRYLLLALVAASVLIPVAYAINVQGQIIFIDNGGNVTFAQNFTCTRINWINSLTRFHGTVWGGVNIGNIGFDVSAGDNMTVTAMTATTLTYNVTSGGGAQSYVYFRGLAAPAQITGDVGNNYNPVTDVLTVNTNGDSVVTLSWLDTDVSTNIRVTSGVLIQLFALIGVIIIMASLGSDATEMRIKLFYYLVATTALMAIAYMLANMGY